MFALDKFELTVESFYKKLEQTPEDITDIRISEDKWALIEIVGHMIDSASNNHQRFVRLQFGDLLDFPPYEAEEWIAAQDYIGMKWSDISSLWHSYNRLLLKVIEVMDEKSLGNVWVKGEDVMTLEQLINDYYAHMERHIGHFENRLEEIRQR